MSEVVELDDKRRLGIATLGALRQYPRISAFRRFIEGWFVSYFTPNAARSLPMAGPQQHLNANGDNLGNVVQFMEREHREKFRGILNRIASKSPVLKPLIQNARRMTGYSCASTTAVSKIRSMLSRCRTAR